MPKQIIRILVLILIIILVWVGFEVFHRAQKPTLPEVIQEQLDPFDPVLEVGILEKLKGREAFMIGEELPF